MEGVRIVVVGGAEAKARFAAMPSRLSFAMRDAMYRSMWKVLGRVSDNLTGKVLNIKSGKLRQSMAVQVSDDGTLGKIGTNIEYARIHEYGGVTKSHAIFPKRAKVLSFMDGGTRQFRKWVAHPGSVIPPRPYMRPALNDSLPEIRAIFRDRIAAEMAKP
jgi:phage gpG-like protein